MVQIQTLSFISDKKDTTDGFRATTTGGYRINVLSNVFVIPSEARDLQCAAAKKTAASSLVLACGCGRLGMTKCDSQH